MHASYELSFFTCRLLACLLLAALTTAALQEPSYATMMSLIRASGLIFLLPAVFTSVQPLVMNGSSSLCSCWIAILVARPVKET